MNQLATAIQSLGLTGTAAEIAAAFQAEVDLPHVHDLWTYNGVANTLGPVVAEGIASAMTAAGLTTAVVVYASRGFDLSLDLTRAQLGAIAAAIPSLTEACAALKAIGRPKQVRWQHAGLGAEPSEADVTVALAQIAFAEWAENAIQTLRAAINGEQTDFDAVLQLIAGS